MPAAVRDDPAVVLHRQDHALLFGFRQALLHALHDPLAPGRVVDAFGRPAREDPQRARAHVRGVVDPLPDFGQVLVALLAGRQAEGGAHRGARHIQAEQERPPRQPMDVRELQGFGKVVGRHLDAVHIHRGAGLQKRLVRHRVGLGLKILPIGVGARADPKPRLAAPLRRLGRRRGVPAVIAPTPAVTAADKTSRRVIMPVLSPLSRYSSRLNRSVRLSVVGVLRELLREVQVAFRFRMRRDPAPAPS